MNVMSVALVTKESTLTNRALKQRCSTSNVCKPPFSHTLAASFLHYIAAGVGGHDGVDVEPAIVGEQLDARRHAAAVLLPAGGGRRHAGERALEAQFFLFDELNRRLRVAFDARRH